MSFPINIPILFDVPAEFARRHATGEIIRYGSILKDSATGRIVGHMQETGLLQNVLQSGLSLDPTGMSSVIGIAQNAHMSQKLSAIQSTLGTMQTLQIATLASSVVGIGVTAASTAMILNRLTKLDDKLKGIEASIDALPSRLHKMNLSDEIGAVGTAAERIDQAGTRPDGIQVVQSSEERLGYAFDKLHGGMLEVVAEDNVDPAYLHSLLAGLALCGSVQFKALIWLDHKEHADAVAQSQSAKLSDLAFRMPRDVLASKMDEGSPAAATISQDYSEIRYRIASQPELTRSLIAHEVHGRAFLDRIQQEEDEPLLILPPVTS